MKYSVLLLGFFLLLVSGCEFSINTEPSEKSHKIFPSQSHRITYMPRGVLKDLKYTEIWFTDIDGSEHILTWDGIKRDETEKSITFKFSKGAKIKVYDSDN